MLSGFSGAFEFPRAASGPTGVRPTAQMAPVVFSTEFLGTSLRQVAPGGATISKTDFF